VVPCAFEAWQDVPGSYDLFLSAQAFHWIDPAYGLARAAELLKARGTIALVWRLDRSQGSAFWQATEPIYNTYNPQTSSGDLPLETKVDLYRHALRTSRQFTDVHEKAWSATKRYTGEEYLKLLQTVSVNRAMPEPNKARFFEEIGRVIVQMGGEVIRDYETLALLAKKG